MNLFSISSIKCQVLQVNPLSVIDRLEALNSQKLVTLEGQIQRAHDQLNTIFNGQTYVNAQGKVKPIMFYCSASISSWLG